MRLWVSGIDEIHADVFALVNVPISDDGSSLTLLTDVIDEKLMCLRDRYLYVQIMTRRFRKISIWDASDVGFRIIDRLNSMDNYSIVIVVSCCVNHCTLRIVKSSTRRTYNFSNVQ